MAEIKLTVAIPVGPRQEHGTWLYDAVQSVRRQTVPCLPLIIDDMHGISLDDPRIGGAPVWYAPWRMGIPCAFNFGVALAPTECVIMLGADDTLEPDAAEACLDAYENAVGAPDRTYFGLPVRYMDTGEEQYLPCNEAMVTKSLWKATGGFPPESAVGACDAAFLSSIWNSDEFKIQMVGRKPLCNYRRHSSTDTATRPVAWQGPILEVRNLLTPLVKPEWGRYE